MTDGKIFDARLSVLKFHSLRFFSHIKTSAKRRMLMLFGELVFLSFFVNFLSDESANRMYSDYHKGGACYCCRRFADKDNGGHFSSFFDIMYKIRTVVLYHKTLFFTTFPKKLSATSFEICNIQEATPRAQPHTPRMREKLRF